MDMGRKVLVVEDDKNICDIICYNLAKEGYTALKAHDGETGLTLALKENPELVMLDIMMPKMDGFEVCRKIREKSQVPIIMLTARAEEIDKVLGFELGADDYVTKPFGVRELMARVKANLRRSETQPAEEGKKSILNFHEISFNLDLYEIKRKGQVIDLTRREFELTKFLAMRKNQVFSREQLLEKVWGFEFYGDVRTVDVTIRRLRAKLEENPENPKYILTKRGVGYYFSD
jgi:two-component system response regulator VicR